MVAVQAMRAQLTGQFQQAANGAARASAPFVMTDIFFIIAVGLLVMWGIDPFHGYLDKRPVIKHIPMVLFILATVLMWLGAGLFKRGPQSFSAPQSVLLQVWPWALLAGWAIVGSVYARYVGKIEETFLTMGVYMMAMFVVAFFVRDHPSPRRLLRAYVGMTFALIIVGAVYQLSFETKTYFHELQYVTVPLGVVMYLSAQSTKGRLFALLWFGLCIALAVKNTSVLVALVCVGYLLLVRGWPASRRLNVVARANALYFSLLAVILALGGLFLVRLVFSDHLPTGNPKYRLHTYEVAWARFLDSPYYGKLFAGAGAERFSVFEVAATTQVLPTHSDILDIAAQGGLLGLILFFWGGWIFVRCVVRASRSAKRLIEPELMPYVHWLAAACVSAVVVIAFNPIMLQPGKAFILWFNAGALLGIAMRWSAGSTPSHPATLG